MAAEMIPTAWVIQEDSFDDLIVSIEREDGYIIVANEGVSPQMAVKLVEALAVAYELIEKKPFPWKEVGRG
jgi:hypothetical protein